MAGIIQGQIVDAFGELRGEQDEMRNDYDEFCLVCSLDRFTLDKVGQGFLHHREDRHSPWNYLLLLHAIRDTPECDDFGMQAYVRRQLQQNLNEFIPVGACSDYSEEGCASSTSMEDVVGKVNALENKISARLSNIENTLQQLVITQQVAPK